MAGLCAAAGLSLFRWGLLEAWFFKNCIDLVCECGAPPPGSHLSRPLAADFGPLELDECLMGLWPN